MPEMKHIEPRGWEWLTDGGVTKIKLSHNDIQQIQDSAEPIAAITALVPQAGGVISAAISSIMYLVKKANEQSGNRGIVIEVRFSRSFSPLYFGQLVPRVFISSPDSW